MANIHFLRKLACDELMDTLYFATGKQIHKEKTANFIILKAGEFDLQVYSNRKIIVNGTKCTSIPDAKWKVQRILSC